VNPGGTVLPLNEILRYSISESDGTASDVLLDAAGGPPAVQQYLTSIGNGEAMIVADSEKSIGKDWETQYRNWASPEASVNLLRAIQERRAGLSSSLAPPRDLRRQRTTGCAHPARNVRLRLRQWFLKPPAGFQQ
jgi:beta-lactamase class A